MMISYNSSKKACNKVLYATTVSDDKFPLESQYWLLLLIGRVDIKYYYVGIPYRHSAK